MKVSELFSTYEAFKNLSDKELPFAEALTVAENMDVLKTAYDVADKKRKSIMNDSLEKDENGDPISVGENQYKLRAGNTLEKDMGSLLEEEVALEELTKIAREKLADISIKPDVLLAIKKYII